MSQRPAPPQLPYWSQVLRALREARGISREAWADLLGYGCSTVKRWESGSAVPGAAAEAALVALCRDRGLFRAYDHGVLQGVTLTPASLADLLLLARMASTGTHHDAPNESAAPPAGSLPLDVTELLGREAEVATVHALLGTHRLVTITGQGGVGKTRLALAVARRLLPDFPDGLFFVDLAPLTDPALVPSAVAHVVGVLEQGRVPVQEQVLGWVRSRRVVLVLDNLEHLPAAAPFIAALLQATPGVVLVTSRAPLRIRGEQEFTLGPLPVPEPRPGLAAAVTAEPAFALFAARARGVRPDFLVTEENAGAISAICARLDGLPLAIELAAARMRVESPAAVLAQLDRPLSVLTDGFRDAPARQQSLRATIAWSYNALAPDLRRQFRRLAVFAGGWSRDAAGHVVSDVGDDAGAALTELVSASLVTASMNPSGETRFGMHAAIRAFASERLAAEDDDAAVRHRHSAYYAALAAHTDSELDGPAAAAWQACLDEVSDNLRAALAWYLQSKGERTLGLQLAGDLGRYWLRGGALTEGRSWLARCLAEAPPERVVPAYARALVRDGLLAQAQGDMAEARLRFDAVVALLRDGGDGHELATALRGLAHVLLLQGAVGEARAPAEESVRLERAVGNERGLAESLFLLSGVCAWEHDYPLWEAVNTECLAVARRAGNTRAAAWALNARGERLRATGDISAAAALYEEALRTHQGDLWLTVVLQINLAAALLSVGSPERAAELLGAGLQLCVTHGLWQVGAFLVVIGELAVSLGETVQGTRLLAAGRAQLEQRGIVQEPLDRREFECAQDEARARLGDDAFDNAWAQGSALSEQTAIALGTSVAAAYTGVPKRGRGAQTVESLRQAAPFVGREQELATLLRRLEDIGSGEGGVVVISGEPGIGKTRLLREVSEHAEARGVLVLVGHAYEMDGLPPYLPFREALGDYIRRYGLTALREHLGAGIAQLTALLPELQGRMADRALAGGNATDYARYALFEAVADCLCTIAQAAQGGLLLVLEDLHWADAASLLLVQYLAHRLAGVPLLLAISARASALDQTAPLQETLAALSREASTARLRLTALGEADAARLIAGIGRIVPAPAVANALQRESAGNPFFLTELVRHLQSEGRDLADADAATTGWGIPDSVRDVIGRRLAQLSPETNRLLRATAVLGDGFSAAELGAMTATDSLSLLEGLDEALAAGLLHEDGDRYRFAHALVRQTLDATLRLPERQQLHLRAAEALIQAHAVNLDPYLSAVAGHYRRAEALADPTTVLAYIRRAAVAAEAVFAWETAADHLQAAVAIAESRTIADERHYGDLLLALGEVQRRAGNGHASQEAFRRAVSLARSLGDAEGLAHAALGLAGRWPDGYEAELESRTLLQETAANLAGEDSALRAMVLARLAVSAVNIGGALDAGQTAEELGHEAVAIAERSGDRDAQLYTLNVLHLLLWRAGTAQRRLAIANEILALAESHGDRDSALEGRHWRLIDLLELGQRDAFDRELAAYDRLTEEFRQPFHRWAALVTRATAALLDGRLAESERLAHEALRVVGDARGSLAAALHCQQVAQICVFQGRLDEAAARTERLEALGQRFDWQILAGLYSELGRTADAARVLATMPEPGPPNGVAQRAQACFVVGDRARAARLYAGLEAYPDLIMVGPFAASCGGPVAHALGLLATTLERWDAAEQHFALAVDLADRLRAPLQRAHSLRAHAEMLTRRCNSGDGERAHALFAQAAALYDNLGAAGSATSTRRLMTATSGAADGTAAARLPHPNGLSDREVEVLGLLVSGHSNRDIAERLVLSVRTVERHVDHIYQKLGVHGRGEARRYAVAHRVVRLD